MSEAPWPLSRTQRHLWRLITAPEGVQKALDADGDPGGSVLAEVLVSDQRLSAVERLDVYANMYFARLLDVLRKDFPVLERVIGHAHFHNLATDYLLAHPPSHFSLRYAGEPLAVYLESHALASDRPWLADLARLEWSIVDTFDDLDAVPITASALASVGAEQWSEIRFAAVPALRILELGWQVRALWLAARDDAADTSFEPARHPQSVRVWRKDLEVLHREIDDTERLALAALREGESFGEICVRVAEAEPEGSPAERSATLLATWLADGLVARLDVGPIQATSMSE